MEPAERDLLQRTLQLSEENNRMLHKMRHAQMWGRVIKIIWWAVIFAVSAYSYYYYVWPYMQQILGAYQNVQHTGAQAQSLQEQIQHAFSQFLSGSSTPR